MPRRPNCCTGVVPTDTSDGTRTLEAYTFRVILIFRNDRRLLPSAVCNLSAASRACDYRGLSLTEMGSLDGT